MSQAYQSFGIYLSALYEYRQNLTCYDTKRTITTTSVLNTGDYKNLSCILFVQYVCNSVDIYAHYWSNCVCVCVHGVIRCCLVVSLVDTLGSEPYKVNSVGWQSGTSSLSSHNVLIAIGFLLSTSHVPLLPQCYANCHCLPSFSPFSLSISSSWLATCCSNSLSLWFLSSSLTSFWCRHLLFSASCSPHQFLP